GMAATAPMMFSGFQLIGYRRAGGISAGTPKSVTLIRWTAPVSRTTTQPGANGRVPASQRRVAPDTNRALPSRPSTSTSTSRRARGPHEVAGGRARFEHVEAAVDDLTPPCALVAMAALGAADDKRAAEVGRVALVVDAGVDPDHVAGRERPVGCGRREHDIAGDG